MASIDDFFVGENNGPTLPRLRDWKKRIEAGTSISLELVRPLVGFGLSRVIMLLHFTVDGESLPTEECDWDEHLNVGLIQLKVRAISPQDEAERFAMGLRDGFQVVEKEFGNGYFNALLLDLIADSKLDQYAEIAEAQAPSIADNSIGQATVTLDAAMGLPWRSAVGPMNFEIRLDTRRTTRRKSSRKP